MLATPTPQAATMLHMIVNRLARLLPQPPCREPAQPWFNGHSSWHSSSFELARGLVVIEHAGASAVAIVDTLPVTTHQPEA